MKKQINFFLDIIFPPKCIFCNEILSPGTEIEICKTCSKKNSVIQGSVCNQCGQPIHVSDVQEKCFDCSRSKQYFKQGISIYEYRGKVKKAMVHFKFFGKKRYAVTFGKLMSDKIKQMTNWPEFDIIIYVPLHKTQLRKRGYNQAKLLAKELAQELNVPLRINIIRKDRQASHQRKLNRFQRQMNMRNTFEVDPNVSIEGLTVLLVDDIYTTGATMNECARIMIKAGAKQVYIVTAAIGKGI